LFGTHAIVFVHNWDALLIRSAKRRDRTIIDLASDLALSFWRRSKAGSLEFLPAASPDGHPMGLSC
jgi:hypothetical protein